MKDTKKIYYQITLQSLCGELLITLKTKWRSAERAFNAMQRFKKKGLSGCLVALWNNGRDDYGILDTHEFQEAL